MAVHKFPLRIKVEPFTAAEVEFDDRNYDRRVLTAVARLNLTLPSKEVVALPVSVSGPFIEAAKRGELVGLVISDLAVSFDLERERD